MKKTWLDDGAERMLFIGRVQLLLGEKSGTRRGVPERAKGVRDIGLTEEGVSSNIGPFLS